MADRRSQQSFISKLSSFFSGVKNRLQFRKAQIFAKTQSTRTVRFIDKHPLTSFFVALAILFIVILGANFLKPKPETLQKPELVKSVETYKIGETPKISTNAKVEKSGVITVTALAGGVVSSIGVTEGQTVTKGTNLVQLSSNYQGGNAPGVQASLAYAQYKNVQDTFQTQKDLINEQRDIANKTDANAGDLRDIAGKSKDDTQSLLDLNNDILNSINNNLTDLQNNNVGGANDAQILQTKQLKSQYQSAVNQLNTQIRNLVLQTDTTKAQEQLPDVQKDITMKQLDIQEKALELSKETSGLQSQLAQISADTMHPVAPFSGTVQKVFVRVGQNVTPGTELFTIAGNAGDIKATAYVPLQVAKQVSLAEPSTIHILHKQYEAVPTFVSTEAVSGELYAVIYTIPQEDAGLVLEGGYVTIDIPVGLPDTSGAVPFIPLDSVTQTQDQAYVFVANNGKAENRMVTLGDVYGRFVQIATGLKPGDQVILSRNVVNGDKVTTQ